MEKTDKIISFIKELGYEDFIFIATRNEGEEITLNLCENAITALGLLEYAKIEAQRQIGGHNEPDHHITSDYRN